MNILNIFNNKFTGGFILGGIFALSLNKLLEYIINDIINTAFIESYLLGYL